MLHQYYDQNEENMIKGLDDDEIEFLDLVDRTKIAADRKKELEEEIELNDYRNRVATLQEKTLEERLQAEIAVNKPKPISNRPSQQKLLKGIVVKKNEAQKRKNSNGFANGNDDEAKRPKLENEGSNLKKIESVEEKHQKLENRDDKQEKTNNEESKQHKVESEVDEEADNANPDKTEVTPNTGLQCVGILPGLGCYNESTSDENSSDSEVEQNNSKMDILGRKIVTKAKESS